MNKSEEYRFLYDLVLHESKAAWDTGQLFLIANTFLAAIIGINFNSTRPNMIYLALLVVGLIISVLWHFSYKRVISYYHFRLAEAKEYEEKNNLRVFSGNAELLARGGTIKVNKETQDLKVHGINLPSLVILGWVIKLFTAFYLFAILIYLFTFLRVDIKLIN